MTLVHFPASTKLIAKGFHRICGFEARLTHAKLSLLSFRFRNLLAQRIKSTLLFHCAVSQCLSFANLLPGHLLLTPPVTFSHPCGCRDQRSLWWRRLDLNQRSPQGASVLQTDGFSHSPTPPKLTDLSSHNLYRAQSCHCH